MNVKKWGLSKDNFKNISFEDFRPIDEKTISYGLNAIKMLFESSKQLLERVDNGSYISIFSSSCSRVDQQK